MHVFINVLMSFSVIVLSGNNKESLNNAFYSFSLSVSN